MTCSACGGPTASDVTGSFYCVICGMQVHPSVVREWRLRKLYAALNDTAEYKPLMAEELPQ
jgi:uncharacterized Zn finger protein (UPF0148 family)